MYVYANIKNNICEKYLGFEFYMTWSLILRFDLKYMLVLMSWNLINP